MTAAATWVGQSIERVEDAALLTGRGRYIDDLGVPPGTLHAAILRSPHRACRHPQHRCRGGARRAGRRRGGHRRRCDRARGERCVVGVQGADPVLADRGRSRALCRRAGRGRRRGGSLSRRGRAGTDRGRLRAAAGRVMRSARCARSRRRRCCTKARLATSRATARSATAIPEAAFAEAAHRIAVSRSTIRATPARRSKPTA